MAKKTRVVKCKGATDGKPRIKVYRGGEELFDWAESEIIESNGIPVLLKALGHDVEFVEEDGGD